MTRFYTFPPGTVFPNHTHDVDKKVSKTGGGSVAAFLIWNNVGIHSVPSRWATRMPLSRGGSSCG